jgi:uncharacterized membrane-anchored protein
VGIVLRKLIYGLSVIVWVFVVLCAIAVPARAYVDPGSGLLALQTLGSTLAGLAFFLRKRIRNVLYRIGRPSAGGNGNGAE